MQLHLFLWEMKHSQFQITLCALTQESICRYNNDFFNYRLSRARRYVECAFGILANKWRILHRAMNVQYEFATDIIKACCVLHNFVLNRDGVQASDDIIFDDSDLQMLEPLTTNELSMSPHLI